MDPSVLSFVLPQLMISFNCSIIAHSIGILIDLYKTSVMNPSSYHLCVNMTYGWRVCTFAAEIQIAQMMPSFSPALFSLIFSCLRGLWLKSVTLCIWKRRKL